MGDLLISFDIVTGSATVSELTALLGVDPSPSKSHDKGSPRFRGQWPVTVWSLVSPLDRSDALEEHLTALFAQLSLIGAERISQIPQDSTMFLSIAVFCDRPQKSFVIPARFIEEVSIWKLSVEVSFYLVSSEEEGSD